MLSTFSPHTLETSPYRISPSIIQSVESVAQIRCQWSQAFSLWLDSYPALYPVTQRYLDQLSQARKRAPDKEFSNSDGGSGGVSGGDDGE